MGTSHTALVETCTGPAATAARLQLKTSKTQTAGKASFFVINLRFYPSTHNEWFVVWGEVVCFALKNLQKVKVSRRNHSFDSSRVVKKQLCSPPYLRGLHKTKVRHNILAVMPVEVNEKVNCKRQHQQADHLRSGQQIAEVVAARIVAHKLQQKSCDRVVGHIGDENLALKSLSLAQNHQQRNRQKHKSCFVKLRRMNF